MYFPPWNQGMAAATPSHAQLTPPQHALRTKRDIRLSRQETTAQQTVTQTSTSPFKNI